MQRTLVRALQENPDVGYADVGRALRHYDSLGSLKSKQALRRTAMATGDDGVAVISGLSDESANVLFTRSRGSNGVATDGGGTSARVVRIAKDNPGLDVDEFLAETGEEGRDLVARLDDATGAQVIRQFEAGELDAGHAARTNELIDAGAMDRADVTTLTTILETKDISDFFDADLDSEDVLEVCKKGDLSETQVLAKDESGDVRWLEKGQHEGGADDYGWEHIEERHIKGKEKDQKGGTHFWPVGQTIEGRKLPSNPSEALSEEDVKYLLYKAIKNSDMDDQDRIRYELPPKDQKRFGIKRIQLGVRDGTVSSAWPTEGKHVHKWIKDIGWEDRDL